MTEVTYGGAEVTAVRPLLWFEGCHRALLRWLDIRE
jgi:hypothetical protein